MPDQMQDPDPTQQPQAVPPDPPEDPPKPSSSADAAPDFEPLPDEQAQATEAEQSPDFEDITAAAPEVIPFTDEEIYNGTAWATIFGLNAAGFNLKEEEKPVFLEAFRWLNKLPPIQTKFLIESLEVGKALAEYGIHKNMAVNQMLGKMHQMPVWIRLFLFLGGMSLAGFNAVKAVNSERVQEQTAPYSGPSAAGTGSDPDSSSQAAQ